MGVADPVEDHDDRAPGKPFRQPAAHHRGRPGQAVRRAGPNLVDGILRQQSFEGWAVEHLDRFGAAFRVMTAVRNTLGLRRRHQCGSRVRLAGEHRQPAPAPQRVGQGGGDRVAAIDPALAAPIVLRRGARRCAPLSWRRRSGVGGGAVRASDGPAERPSGPFDERRAGPLTGSREEPWRIPYVTISMAAKSPSRVLTKGGNAPVVRVPRPPYSRRPASRLPPSYAAVPAGRRNAPAIWAKAAENDPVLADLDARPCFEGADAVRSMTQGTGTTSPHTVHCR